MSPTRLQEALKRVGPVFSQLYGQTECYPISLLRKAVTTSLGPSYSLRAVSRSPASPFRC